MQRVERETRVCANVEIEPGSRITGESVGRREKVWLSGAEKLWQVDERGKERRRDIPRMVS